LTWQLFPSRVAVVTETCRSVQASLRNASACPESLTVGSNPRLPSRHRSATQPAPQNGAPSRASLRDAARAAERRLKVAVGLIPRTINTVRRSRKQPECARPRAQKRRKHGGVGAIPSVQPCVACCGRDGRTPKISSQHANNFGKAGPHSDLRKSRLNNRNVPQVQLHVLDLDPALDLDLGGVRARARARARARGRGAGFDLAVVAVESRGRYGDLSFCSGVAPRWGDQRITNFPASRAW
jgi:hypothetical protein